MYQDYKPCRVCGSEVRLSTDQGPRQPEPDGPVETRICTNAECPSNQAGDDSEP